jgi:hypothetical protein
MLPVVDRLVTCPKSANVTASCTTTLWRGDQRLPADGAEPGDGGVSVLSSAGAGYATSLRLYAWRHADTHSRDRVVNSFGPAAGAPQAISSPSSFASNREQSRERIKPHEASHRTEARHFR